MAHAVVCNDVLLDDQNQRLKGQIGVLNEEIEKLSTKNRLLEDTARTRPGLTCCAEESSSVAESSLAVLRSSPVADAPRAAAAMCERVGGGMAPAAPAAPRLPPPSPPAPVEAGTARCDA